MWQRVHLLGAVQSFFVASVTAAIVAFPFALRAMSRIQISSWELFRLPHELEVLVAFTGVFLLLLQVLLSYYHLGKLGLLLSVGLAILTYVVISVSMTLLGMFATKWVAVCRGSVIGLLFYLMIFWGHLRVAKSHMIQKAQRDLQLYVHSG